MALRLWMLLFLLAGVLTAQVIVPTQRPQPANPPQSIPGEQDLPPDQLGRVRDSC